MVSGSSKSVFSERKRTANGRFFCLPETQVQKLDVSMEAFHSQLRTGEGSLAWLQALADKDGAPRPAP